MDIKAGSIVGHRERFVGLLVEPNVFHAPTVEQAVHHDREPFNPRLPAG